MTLQILQISNGFILFESIDEMAHAIYVKNKTELVDILLNTLPETEEI